MRFDQWNGFVELEEKALSEESDHFVLRGYAATFHDVDRVQDAIQPGAFAKCLDRMKSKGESLQLYLNHQLDIPIGSIEAVGEDKKGLRYEAHLPKDDALVRDRVVPQIRRRSLKANSFGYKVKKSERRKSDNVRLLQEIDIYEISVVGMPANPAALIEHISKSVTPYQDDLPIEPRDRVWDAECALRRIQSKFVDGEGKPTEEARRAFLFVDEEKADDWSAYKLQIADVDENGGLICSRHAIYRAVASLSGARKGGLGLSEDVEEAIRENLGRYYDRLNLKAPFSSISIPEWKALSADEREARLRGLGVTGDLARSLAAMQLKGPREADRSSVPREAGPTVDAKTLHTAMSDMSSAATAILQFAKDLRNP